MRKYLLYLFSAGILLIAAPSCSTTRDVDKRDEGGVVIKKDRRVNAEGDVVKREKRVDDNGVEIRRKKRDRSNDNDDKETTVKIRKERKDREPRKEKDEPVLIIDNH